VLDPPDIAARLVKRLIPVLTHPNGKPAHALNAERKLITSLPHGI